MNAANRSLCALVAILTGQFGFESLTFADTPTITAPRAHTSQKKVKLEGRYSGPWVTTNRKLDGVMTCDVTQLAHDRWQGRFWGEWQKVPFDYTVEFMAGEKQLPPMASQRTARPVAFAPRLAETPVMGTAMIDGASYEWTGLLSPEAFNVRFTGSRYEGHFELKRARQ